jgi:hypothetical protein
MEEGVLLPASSLSFHHAQGTEAALFRAEAPSSSPHAGWRRSGTSTRKRCSLSILSMRGTDTPPSSR